MTSHDHDNYIYKLLYSTHQSLIIAWICTRFMFHPPLPHYRLDLSEIHVPSTIPSLSPASARDSQQNNPSWTPAVPKLKWCCTANNYFCTYAHRGCCALCSEGAARDLIVDNAESTTSAGRANPTRPSAYLNASIASSVAAGVETSRLVDCVKESAVIELHHGS